MLATSFLASSIWDEREHGILQVVVTIEKLQQRFNRPLQNIKKVIYKHWHLLQIKEKLQLCFNRPPPNITKIINKHWHLLQMKPKLKNAFQERPIIVYKKNGNLKILESDKILTVKIKHIKRNQERSTFFVACVTQYAIIAPIDK